MFVDYLTKVFDFGKFRYGKQLLKPPSSKQWQNNLNPWEARFVDLQSVLIWEKPKKSIIAILIVNLLYWYLVYSEVQLYFGFSMLGLVSFLHNQWVYYIWPEISVPNINADQEEWTPVHPCILSAPELSRYLRNCLSYIQEQFIRLAQLRRKQPGYFCAISVTFFCFLWMVGHFISGVILLYGFLMALMCGPGFIINCIPKSTIDRVRDFWSMIFAPKNDCDDRDIAEFLPEESLPELEFEVKKKIAAGSSDSLPPRPNAPQLTPLLHSRGSKKGRRRHISPSRDSIKSGSSFTSGLSEGDFPSLTSALDDSDEMDLALSEIPPGETTRIISDISDSEMRFLPAHFGASDQQCLPSASSFSCHSSFTGLDLTDSCIDEGNLLIPKSEPTSVMNQLMTEPSSVMNQLMNIATVENTTALLSNLGQRVACALSSENGSRVSNSDLKVNKGGTGDLSGSNLEEDFEVISDDEVL